MNRGGSQRGADAIGVPSDKAAGQRLVSSDERSCRQRIALTLRIVGGFPMTHHVECAALLSRVSMPTPPSLKYARVERERRWLLRSLPGSLSV